MANSRAVGCSCPGPHVHVVRREDNENLALSKRRRELVVPAHPWVVGVYAAYCVERDRVPAACRSDFVFVNLAGGELGRAMRDGRAREVVGGARAAGRDRAGRDAASVPSRARDRAGGVGPFAGRGPDDPRPRSGRDDASLHAHVARAAARGDRERGAAEHDAGGHGVSGLLAVATGSRGRARRSWSFAVEAEGRSAGR